MSIEKRMRKVMVVLLSLCLIFSSFGMAAAKEQSSDIKGHWAEQQITSWIDKGLIKGFSDGSFKPDKTITRGEFMSLVNRSFGFTETADVKFKDLKPAAWVYQDVRKAVKAGYIHGYSDSTIRYNQVINRQESALIIAGLLNLANDTASTSGFSDAAKIASWAKGSVGAIAAKKLLEGIADKSFNPTKELSRAEAVVLLDRALQARVVSYNAAGTYGPATGTQTLQGNVAITVGGVTLKNVVINGNLLLADSIGEGDVFLDNVTVKGTTTVKGGGPNSIHFKDSVLFTIVVNKQTGEVRIVAEGQTTVQQVNLNSPTTLQSDTNTGSGFSNVTLTNDLPAGSKVTLKGSFNNVEVNSSNGNIDIPQGSINKLTTTDDSKGVSLNLGKDSKIKDLVLDSGLKVSGQGTIDKATVSEKAKGSTFEKQPTKTEGSGAPASSQPPTSSGNGGGGDTTAPTISAVTGSAITDTSATLNFTSNEAGTYYYVVYADTDPAPNAATIALQGSAVAKGTAAASSSANSVNVTGLTASTAYKAYVIVKDVAGNASNVATIVVTTKAVLTGTATITGTAQEGQTLTAALAGGNNTGTLSYQWKSNAAIVGTNSTTYVPVAGDIGKTITVVITSSVQAGSVTSSATSAVIAAALTGTAVITGTAQEGQTLTAALNGSNNTGTLSYQWKSNAAIVGTNSITYVPVAGDIGNTITVVITSNVQSGSVTSSATSAVNAAAVAALTGTAVITGTAQEGQTLTAALNGSNNTGTLSYQWKSNAA
ncbi:S-layer homology domain-containing protein, partial [Cohnella silvisoli]